MSPNNALQRTRSAPLRSPLSCKPLGAALRALVIAAGVAMVLGCDSRSGGRATAEGKGVGSKSLDEIAKVHVDAAGSIFLNGRPATLDDLRKELARVKAANGSVWYSRANTT